MRMLMLLVLGLLATTAPCVRAQNGEEARAKTEHDAADALVRLWERAEYEAVRRQAVETLKQMGRSAAPTLARALKSRVLAVPADAQGQARGLATAALAANLLGQMGNLVVAEDLVLENLLFVAQLPTAGGPEADPRWAVRQEAIEALGKVFANKGVFLILDRKEVWLKEELVQHTPREMATFMQNEFASLKVQFHDLWHAAEPATRARNITLEARNLRRHLRPFRKLINLMSELERQPEKEEELALRIDKHFLEMEHNLQIAATDPSVAARKLAIARAEEHAHELFEEAEKINYNIAHWQKLNRATAKVIGTLQRQVSDEEPLIRFVAAEALRRIYGSRD